MALLSGAMETGLDSWVIDGPKPSLRDIDALFRLGVVSGMSDGQLLERLRCAAQGPDSELAFEAIVRRHGPWCWGFAGGCWRRARRRRCFPGHLHGAGDEVAYDSQARFTRPLAARRGGADCSPRGRCGGGTRRGIDAAGWRGRPGGQDGGAVDFRASARRGVDPVAGEVPHAARILLPGGPDARAGRPDARAGPRGRSRAGWPEPRTCCGTGSRSRGLAPSAGLVAAALSTDSATAAVPPALVLPTGASGDRGVSRRNGDRPGHGTGGLSAPAGDEGDADGTVRPRGRTGIFPRPSGRRRWPHRSPSRRTGTARENFGGRRCGALGSTPTSNRAEATCRPGPLDRSGDPLPARSRPAAAWARPDGVIRRALPGSSSLAMARPPSPPRITALSTSGMPAAGARCVRST